MLLLLAGPLERFGGFSDSPYAGQRKTPYAPRSFSPGNSTMSIWGKLAGAAAELVRGGPTDSQVAFTVGRDHVRC
jgi:hypothetical protein